MNKSKKAKSKMSMISKKTKKTMKSKNTKKTKSKSTTKSKSKSRSRVSNNCKIMKKIPPSSEKFLEAHKNLLVCADNKCKEFLDKDIEISETCFNKTLDMKFNDPKKMKVEFKCFDKLGMLENTLNKIKCLKRKCGPESKKYQKFPSSEHNPEAIRDFSDFERKKYQLQQKREKVFPELIKIRKLDKKRHIIQQTIDNCKNESEKTKLKIQRDKITELIEQFFAPK
jgi:hypothetical protein